MSILSTRTKYACLLVAIQTAGVGVGLWMERGHVVSSLRHSLEQQTWQVLEESVARLATDLEPSTAHLTGGAVGDWPSKTGLDPATSGVIFTDTGGRVRHAEGSFGTLPPGQTLAWTPVQSHATTSGRARRGTLTHSGGEHFAVSIPVALANGQLVVCRSADSIHQEARALAQPLSAITAITLFWIVAVMSIAVFVVLGRLHERVEQKRVPSMTGLLRQAQSLVRTRDAVIFGLAKLADSRDMDTGEHLERITAYSTLLATELQQHPKFTTQITPAFVRLIGISAALHDIGKVGIEDRILLTPKRLTAEQRTKMQKHTLIGGECLREIEQRLGSSNFLQMARQIAFAHHERWDGNGYPYGIIGDDIPLAGRIVAIADVYDALSSERVYKPAYPHEQCVAIIRADAGKHFDPDMVEVWLTVEWKFREIAERYAATATAPVEHEPALVLGAAGGGRRAGRSDEEESEAADALSELSALD